MSKNLSLLPKIAALSIAAAFAAPVMAQTAGSNIVNVGWFHLDPRDSSEPLRVVSPSSVVKNGTGAAVNNADTLGVAFTHFFTDNFAVTTDAGIPPKFTLSGTGLLQSAGDLGTAKQWSPAVVAKWYFGEANSTFRPFVGAGVTYVWYSDAQLTPQFQQLLSASFTQNKYLGAASTVELSKSWAPVFNVGASYKLTDSWSLGLSVAYIPLKTSADITTYLPGGVIGKSTTTVTLNPIVTFLSVGYKF